MKNNGEGGYVEKWYSRKGKGTCDSEFPTSNLDPSRIAVEVTLVLNFVNSRGFGKE
jgi:hypothetical protein